ncbi:9135_t:CDS:2, partial [Funneliformis mosseae]
VSPKRRQVISSIIDNSEACTTLEDEISQPNSEPLASKNHNIYLMDIRNFTVSGTLGAVMILAAVEIDNVGKIEDIEQHNLPGQAFPL